MPKDQEPSTDLELSAQDSELLDRFVGTIFGPASFELAQIFGNEMGYLRLKRWVKLASKARSLINDTGIETHEIPHRFGVPLLEAASLEDDEGLQDRWAALLANAATQKVDTSPSLVSVLRELDAIAAQILERVYVQLLTVASEIQHEFAVDTGAIRDTLGVELEMFDFHVDNLVRLGLLSRSRLRPNDHSMKLRTTPFGRVFVRACQPPGSVDPQIRWTDRDALVASIASQQRRAHEEIASRPTEGWDATQF